MRFVFQYGGGIFCYFVIQPFGCVPVAHNGGIMLAQSYALSASHAFGIIYFRFAFCVQMYGIVSAMFYADVTPYAISGVYFRLGRCMQFQFAAYAGTSHSEIFRAPPNPVCSCPLKWFMLIMMSASAIAVPILGVGQYSPSIGISL